MLIYILIIIGIIIFDQFIKVSAVIVLSQSPELTLVFIPGFVNFRFVQNTGAAFSLFSGNAWMLSVCSIIIVAILFVMLYKTTKYKSSLLKTALTFIIGGATGNIIDRIGLGYVRDMIEFTFVQFAIFNVADIFVCIGVVLLGIFLLFYWDKKNAGLNEKNDV